MGDGCPPNYPFLPDRAGRFEQKANIMTMPYHPKCGKRFGNAQSIGHCAVCCETFVGQATFDAHMSRDEQGKYIHLEPVTAEAKHQWWADDRGYWHKGARLTEEQKAKMFGVKE